MSNWLSQMFSIKGFTFLLRCVCVVAAIGFALNSGARLSEANNLSIPNYSLSGGENVEVVDNKPAYNTYASSIIRRNIFGEVKKPTTNNTAPKLTPKVTKLKLRLVGTSVGAGDTPFAMIENTSNRKQDVFELNEEIFEQAKLIEIKAESVRILYNGQMESLLMEEGGGSGASGGAGVSSSGDNQFTVSEQELTNALGNLPRLLSQARAVPYFRNGESVGMRMFAIRKDSLYDKLGLKNGDILRSVNDSDLSDPSQALKIFEKLRNQRSITLMLERKGEEMEMNYSVE